MPCLEAVPLFLTRSPEVQMQGPPKVTFRGAGVLALRTRLASTLA